MKAYLRSTSPNEWSFNKFLYNNWSYLIANDCKNNWDVLNSVWKNKFTDIIMKQTSDEIIINKIQEEETLEHLWFYIENSQTIEVLKHHVIKIRYKINKNIKDTIRNKIRQIINNELNNIKDQIRKEISQELNDIKEQIRKEISQE
ncbi:38561_t:CDS:2 [Gigaspora margarita]|uniref:38561_t:CDS:1 n=1 Tax=Gigaspora margarita TaxID=4874 RepID=A0ABN7V600_GIGMA|nr:38561_t:CDS:2 [Gigaspora margarita]